MTLLCSELLDLYGVPIPSCISFWECLNLTCGCTVISCASVKYTDNASLKHDVTKLLVYTCVLSYLSISYMYMYMYTRYMYMYKQLYSFTSISTISGSQSCPEFVL